MPIVCNPPATRVRFGSFEADLRTGELRKSGMRVKLQEQPFKVLAALLEAPGEMVSRAQLKESIWPDIEFGDFDHALNLAINKLRIALGDSHEVPKFIETVPRHGYRFIAPVESQPENGGPNHPAEEAAPRRRRAGWIVAGVVVAATIIAAAIWTFWRQAPIESIAVVPFATEEPDLRYLADGIANSLTEDLAHLPRIRVASRHSTFQLKDAKLSTRELSRRLQVRGLVTGSIRRMQDGTLRVTVELLDGLTDRHLWGNEYAVRAGQLSNAQSQIAQDVFLGLRYRLDQNRHAQLGYRHTANSQAYDAYLRGKYAIENHDPQKVMEAVRWFNEAVRLDPSFAPGYFGLEQAYGVGTGLAVFQPKDGLPLANAATERALQLAPDTADAHIASAYMQMNFHRNIPAAIAEAKRAIDFEPENSTAHLACSHFLQLHGELSEAVEYARTGMSLDPDWLLAKSVYGMTLRTAGRFQEAVDFGRTLPAPQGPSIVAFALISQGKYEDAIREIENARVHTQPGVSTWVPMSTISEPEFIHAWADAELGRPAALRKMAVAAVESRKKEYSSATKIATLFAILRDRQNTLLWLETALEEQDNLIYNFIPFLGDPEFLRNDPAYQSIRRRMFTPR